MKNYSDQFTPDYEASPVENVRRYISGLPSTPEHFEGLEFQPSARMAFLGEDNMLDTEKVYKEAISGKDIYYEQCELMRYAILLNASKEELSKIIGMMVNEYDPGSSNDPIGESRNNQQWSRRSKDTFGIPPEERNFPYPYKVENVDQLD